MGAVDGTIDSTSSGSYIILGQFISSLAFAILSAFNMNYFMQDFASVILKNDVGTRPMKRPQKTNKLAPRFTHILLVFCGFIAATTNAADLPPSWGLDRVNQCQLPLDSNPTKQNATGVKVFFIGDGMEGDHEELRDMINPDDDCHFSPDATDPLIDDWG